MEREKRIDRVQVQYSRCSRIGKQNLGLPNVTTGKKFSLTERQRPSGFVLIWRRETASPENFMWRSLCRKCWIS